MSNIDAIPKSVEIGPFTVEIVIESDIIETETEDKRFFYKIDVDMLKILLNSNFPIDSIKNHLISAILEFVLMWQEQSGTSVLDSPVFYSSHILQVFRDNPNLTSFLFEPKQKAYLGHLPTGKYNFRKTSVWGKDAYLPVCEEHETNQYEYEFRET